LPVDSLLLAVIKFQHKKSDELKLIAFSFSAANCQLKTAN